MQDSSALHASERRRGDGRCSTGTSSVTPSIRLLWFSVRQRSLENARFLVETLRTRMQRDAESGRRILQRDQLALGVPGVERFTGRVAPKNLDVVVDQVLRLPGPGDPLRGNRDGLGPAAPAVG